MTLKILLTGGARGIGRGLFRHCLQAGHRIIILDSNTEELDHVKKQAEKWKQSGNGDWDAIRCDLRKRDEIKSAVNFVMDKFDGKLDVLINNVGIAGAPGTAVDVDMEAWARSLEINVSSMVLMSKFAIPAMLQNTGVQKGSIVNMGSVAGLKGGTPHLLYPTSKGAVVNMTRAMAAHHAKSGIRVNCVCPGVSQE